jgi:hypothetical protein
VLFARRRVSAACVKITRRCVTSRNSSAQPAGDIANGVRFRRSRRPKDVATYTKFKCPEPVDGATWEPRAGSEAMTNRETHAATVRSECFSTSPPLPLQPPPGHGGALLNNTGCLLFVVLTRSAAAALAASRGPSSHFRPVSRFRPCWVPAACRGDRPTEARASNRLLIQASASSLDPYMGSPSTPFVGPFVVCFISGSQRPTRRSTPRISLVTCAAPLRGRCRADGGLAAVVRPTSAGGAAWVEDRNPRQKRARRCARWPPLLRLFGFKIHRRPRAASSRPASAVGAVFGNRRRMTRCPVRR